MESVNEAVVIQNSDFMYKSDVKWRDDIEPSEITEYEINMLKNSKKIEDILKEEQEELSVKHVKDENKEKVKNLLTMFKVITSNRMGFHPLFNLSTLQPYEAKKFRAHMESLVEDFNNGFEKDIVSEFNDICNSKLFNNGGDVSTFPVYK